MDKPFHLLVVGVGGARITFLERLILGLARQGVTVTLAASRRPALCSQDPGHIRWLWAPAWDGSPAWRGLRLVALLFSRLPSARLGWLWRHVRQAGLLSGRLLALYRLLPFTRGHWDAIYFPWNSAAIAYHALYELGLPVVVSCRGSQINVRPHLPGSESYIQDLRASLRQAAAVHCVSADILREAAQYGLDPDKARVICPAVDPGFFHPPVSPPASSPLVIVTTGALTWQKGHEYALLALRQLLDMGVEAEFHILGDGSERQRVLYTLQDLELDGRVILHGKLHPVEVRDRLQRSDVFLLASHSEGIANAALEAMSCGLPVVTTDCGGMGEAVADGVEGFIVPTRHPAAMAQALFRLSQDPALRRRMGQAARARVLSQFDSRDQVEQYIALFHAAISVN